MVFTRYSWGLDVFCCINDTVCLRFIWMFSFGFFFVRERCVLSSCQLHAYIFIIARNSLWFAGVLRNARRDPKFENILSLENKLKKHTMFRLFYLKSYSFLRRALESCTSIVTHAAQCNTDLYGTDSQEASCCHGNLPGAPTIFLSWDT